MIQIRCLREFTPKNEAQVKRHDKPMNPDLYAESHEEIFNRLHEFLALIPEAEKINCFMTVGHTEVEQKRREQTYQSAIFFDIDGIDPAKKEDYIPAISRALSVNTDDIFLVFSGHGIHILIQTSEHVLKTQKDYQELKSVYLLVCERMDSILEELGLPGKTDRQVFSANRMIRLPGTWNKKEGKEPVFVTTLRAGFKELPFNLRDIALGDMPQISEKDQVDKTEFSKIKVDSKTIESDCLFLKHARENQSKMSEPQWYAALSILSRMPEGERKCHEYSDKHPNYSEHNTNLKIKQALEASGPRTCENINSMWGGCKACPHFGKVKTPLSIKGPDFIATEEMGFYVRGARGALIPQYEDLRRFFAKKHAYKVHKESEQVYIFNGTHYQEFENSEVRGFADKFFKPTPKEQYAKEFLAWVTRYTNTHVDENWFKQTNKFINFKNGVLDTKTGVLHKHSPEFGFTYCLPFEYMPGDRSPTFEKFMAAVTKSDKELSELILEFIGYAICDREYWVQRGMLFVGRGANGKSTLLKIIEMLAGKNNFSALSMNDFHNENHRSQLEGKLLNICDELPISTLKNTEMFKKLMGGTVMVKKLYKNAKIITNMAKFFFSCNELPDINDRSEGLFRRLIIIPFNAKFSLEDGTADPTILKKISGELPGVFNCIYEAYKRLIERGRLIESESANKELKVFRDSINWVQGWFHETFTLLPLNGTTENTPTNIMYEKYTSECARQGEKAMNQRKFMSYIRSFVLDFDKRYTQIRMDGKKPRVLLGVQAAKDEPMSQALSQM